MKAVASYLLGVWDAAVRAPIKPVQGRPWLPRRGWRRWALGAFSVLLGGALTGGTIAELVLALRVPSVLAAFLGLGLALPFVVAPARPLLAWRIMIVCFLYTPLAVTFGPREGVVWPWPVTACVAMLFTLMLIGASHPRPIWFGVGLLSSVAVFVFGVTAGMPFWIGDILMASAFAGLLFGDAIGGRRSIQARLDEQRALRKRDLARQAVLEERGRIARELHDVVAHHMTMIAIQSEAAPLKVPDLPPAAVEIFAQLNKAAREALSETRTVVGLLRSEEEAAERSPAPGLELLDDLVTHARAGGLTVTPAVVGVPRPLSAAVDVSAYRILQEALSNATRYAPGSQVRVEVRYGPEALHLTVTNTAIDAIHRTPVGAATGPPPPDAFRAAEARGGGAGAAGSRGAGERASAAAEAAERASMGGGHGLVGIRERAAMLGGEMSAGPRPGGGWEVTAVLPTNDVA
ncbi:sensor histidine kinase [Cryptosporangium sp. NPDC048952]|uniref:sensor histidine kinase n=1 Tax=Cryptosporangium sp. NPDC048952 TaxID=3363961 RepID=UPI003710ADF8